MSSFTVKFLKSGLQHCQLWMWRHAGSRHWSCSSASPDYVNSHTSVSKTQSTAITSHSSQPRISGLLLSISWRCYSHSGTGPCGCRNGIPLLCILSSLSTMSCLITWITWCELWPGRRHNGRKTYSLAWSLHGRSCPNIILKWLQWLVCSTFRHLFLNLSESCDRLGSRTRESMLIQKTRFHILRNTRRPFRSLWRTNTALNIDVWQSLNPKTYHTTISSALWWLLDLFNLLMIYMISPAIMKNT